MTSWSLSVLPAHQGIGVSRLLMKYIKSYAHENNIDTVIWIVVPENERALNIYRKNKDANEIHGFYIDVASNDDN